MSPKHRNRNATELHGRIQHSYSRNTHAEDDHLSKVYRTEVVETYALRDFNIDVKEGEFVAVTGPSGSGKTTFLTIAGLLETFTGGSTSSTART